MDSIAYFVNSSDDDEIIPAYIQRKRIRTVSNPLNMSSKRFIKLFRVSKELFNFILCEIESQFKINKNKDAISPTLKLAATLRFLAEGSYQQSVGQDFLIGMAQPTVSIVLSETLSILESVLCARYINFDLTDEAKTKSKEYFLRKTGLPGVIGCVDETHINIIKPNVNEHHYFNRKGTHSLNVMMTCDYRMHINSVDAHFGGCSHDSVIWKTSKNRNAMERNWRAGDKSSWILGDAGYTLEPWMMTPFRLTTEGSSESIYNTVHSKARSIIERVFGILKGRWRCILHTRELHYTPEKAGRIVNVCCMLHNLCMMYNVPIDEALIETEEDINPNTNEEVTTENIAEEAKRLRNIIKNNL